MTDITPTPDQPNIVPDKQPIQIAENTQAQKDLHEENENRAAEEQAWDTYQVTISGNDSEWVSRPGQFWMPTVDENGVVTGWEPDPERLPQGATINENGNIVMPAVGVVTCKAQSEEQAKMLALRDNPEYHTVVEVNQLS